MSLLVILLIAVSAPPAIGGIAHDAAENGDVALLKSLIDEGVRVDSRDEIGRTPLHYAKNRQVAELRDDPSVRDSRTTRGQGCMHGRTGHRESKTVRGPEPDYDSDEVPDSVGEGI